MLNALLAIFAKVFGIEAADSAINKIGGAVTHLALLPLITWFVAHANDEISFRTSYGFLALVVGVAYLLLETLRRSRT